jgi:predicted RNA-binding Zn-ribbon protein involved in translation (DUF1610 family)
MNRKQRRALKKKQKKSDLKEKMGLFDMIPENCLACLEPFDKKDKKMVSTWSVVVKEKEKKVSLYCPSCWEAAMQIVKQVHEDEKKENSF